VAHCLTIPYTPPGATNPDSESVQTAHSAGKTPVVYTSRQELVFADVQARLEFGAAVSSLLMDIVVCHLILAFNQQGNYF